MKRLAIIMAATAAAMLTLASPAGADLGFRDVDMRISGTQAGIHPDEVVTTLDMETILEEGGGLEYPDEALRDLTVDLPPGFAGDPTATERCTAAEFAVLLGTGIPSCPNSSAVGYIAVKAEFDPLEPNLPDAYFHLPVFNMEPAPGKAAKLGFYFLALPVTVDVGLREAAPYNIFATLTNISNAAFFYGSELTLWGIPSDSSHNSLRGSCLNALDPSDIDAPISTGANCQASGAEKPFLTAARSCEGPQEVTFKGTAWNTGNSDTATATVDGRQFCGKLGFAAAADVRPTTSAAESASGLSFDLSIEDEGLVSSDPEAIAFSDIKRARVVLPKGMTLNPSQAEGLGVCAEADLARETASSPFGAGCPAASRIGSVEVETPLLEGEILQGSMFVAKPYQNPFGSLLALYMVIKDPALGISVALPARVDTNDTSGQIVTTFGSPTATDPALRSLPQVPLGSVRVNLRAGGRSPLVTPPTCGSYEIKSIFTPWANPGDPYEDSSTFQITSGPDGAPCPAGLPPFSPGFEAGSLNNAAGAHSPFLMRLTRADGEQDLTRFDAVLPPGVTAKLAGVPWCPDHAIALARSRDGKDEQRDPSCPVTSQIGTVQGGAGVGSQLTYVPGKVYLAGPVGGAPLSVVGIVPAVAGPFDVGTIVVRQALDLDPITGQAKVLSAASDDLPHILAGIPLRVRDIQVSVDRPNFTLNPTNCNPMATLAGIWGGGANVFSAHDDFPVLRQARYQAAGCASLGFRPRLAIRLRGGVRRGAHPALRAVVTPKPGEANFSRAVVTLPRSAFLDQAHIRTICTRVQFAAGAGNGAACPPGARYGYARAWSPLLDAPAQGPVYLRSSNNNLPDLVVALRGPASAPVDVELSARIDSVKGGIRSTFTGIPDLPVSRFILDMQGGKKGLIVNSRHLCFKPKRNRARSNLVGQNGRVSRTRPRVVAAKCAKRRKAKRASQAALSVSDSAVASRGPR